MLALKNAESEEDGGSVDGGDDDDEDLFAGRFAATNKKSTAAADKTTAKTLAIEDSTTQSKGEFDGLLKKFSPSDGRMFLRAMAADDIESRDRVDLGIDEECRGPRRDV
jgi:hypothetical protein